MLSRGTDINSQASEISGFDFKNTVFNILLLIIIFKSFMTMAANERHGASLMMSTFGSGIGLAPLGNNPLPEPMSTQIYVAIRRH